MPTVTQMYHQAQVVQRVWEIAFSIPSLNGVEWVGLVGFDTTWFAGDAAHEARLAADDCLLLMT
jgi:hypothetical protein